MNNIGRNDIRCLYILYRHRIYSHHDLINWRQKTRIIRLCKCGNEEDVNNYRPISILPILSSKIRERIAYYRLYSFLEKYNLLKRARGQYGFKKSIGQQFKHFWTIQSMCMHWNIDSGNVWCHFFIDFNKAFDCFYHSILLKN